jgi:glycosyltransferase involved in cell wall biosynthesis
MDASSTTQVIGASSTTQLIGAAPAQPLRVLLSAYACEPARGSEPGIGWNWARHLAEAGHEVCVLTRANNRLAIESALREMPVRRLRFAYYDLPAWARWWKRGGRGVHLYYLLWQWGAFRVARQLHRARPFDVVHHITFGVFRQPSFMAYLGPPFVFGPVGGGEHAPLRLWNGTPWRARFSERVRELANRLVRHDPIMRGVFTRASVILCKTRATFESIPEIYRERCRLLLEVGMDHLAGQGAPLGSGRGGLRALYVGRLLHWKGLHLALRAFARFLGTDPQATFTIVGKGPAYASLRTLARELEIAHAIRWVPWLERERVLELYAEHDVFLFPSLHDSSGNAVLEALSRGLPVICLDNGGPAAIVDETCGLTVPATSPEATINGLVAALQTLSSDTERRRRMALAARERADREFSWTAQADRMTGIYNDVLAGTLQGAR